MGTDYKFYCNKCKKTGGGFSRQAWGTGNADIIGSFRFLMKHAYCFQGFDILSFDDYCDIDDDKDEDLLAYYPHSYEWDPNENNREYERYRTYCTLNRDLTDLEIDLIAPVVSISQKEYERLQKRDEWLLCLEDVGVDGWDGCIAALSLLKEKFDEDAKTPKGKTDGIQSK